jgi:hypothetical protein
MASKYEIFVNKFNKIPAILCAESYKTLQREIKEGLNKQRI